MNINSIWLSHEISPTNPSIYFERALRKKYQVLTIGPRFEEIDGLNWNASLIRNVISQPDIEVSGEIDISKINTTHTNIVEPDLYLSVLSGDQNIFKGVENLQCLTACILTNCHQYLSQQLTWATQFDFVFISELSYLKIFREMRINAYWLPLAVDVEIYKPDNSPKISDVLIIGEMSENDEPINLANQVFSINTLNSNELFLSDKVPLYNQSKIIFHNNSNNELSAELFEAMSCGAFLLTNTTSNSGQDTLFSDNLDYVDFNADDLLEKLKFFLENDDLRHKIALKGMQTIHNAHQYSHRVTDMMNVVVKLKHDTFSPEELLLLSCNDASTYSVNTIKNRLPNTSFVIPVLDYSPSSPYNIKTLLKDLESVPGEVIVVFNNEQVANEIKNHPRINQYSVLKNNVGVSRAWNLGLNISRTRYTFILNADLHIQKSAIDQCLDYITKLPDAAIVGPEGGFTDFKNIKEIYAIKPGKFHEPIEVDAVSGYFFVVDTNLFNQYGISFDNRYTPCYHEEWDIGLQTKQANLKCYAVPVTDFAHQWSGSISSYKKIKYFDEEETPAAIYYRTRLQFITKWLRISTKERADFLESKFKLFATKIIEDSLALNQTENVKVIANNLLELYKNDKDVFATLGLFNLYLNELQIALSYFQSALKIDPFHQKALDGLKLMQPTQN